MTAAPQPVPQRPDADPIGTGLPGPDAVFARSAASGQPGTGQNPDTVDVVLNAERATVGTRLVATERVRVSKHIVTETRTVSIEVRREELRVERLPVTEPDGAAADATPGLRPDDGAPAGLRPDDGAPAVVLVLREEVPQFRLQVVPVERVQVFVDTVHGIETADLTVRHEEVDVTTEPPTSP